MTCLHPNVKLTITWTTEMTTAGTEAIGSRVQPATLRVVTNCPDCIRRGIVYTTMDNWETRWPKWLLNRMDQLQASNHTLRQAMKACMPGLIRGTYP